MNTTRGEAISCAIEYALWVFREEEKLHKAKGIFEFSFDKAPEVREALEYHLQPKNDPSIAVRAVYGRFFPWLLLMDRKWTIDNIPHIFSGDFDHPLYKAAWDSYIAYTLPYDDPFSVLQSQYKTAVVNLGKVTKKEGRFIDRDRHLVEHLMSFYWRGLLPLEDPLTKLFWSTSNAESRGYALDFLGRSLQDDNNNITEEIAQRLVSLWQNRYTIASTAADKTEYEKEMAAFGWWFASGKLEETWSCEEYLKALEIATKVQTEYFVTQRLVEISKRKPLKAVQILSKLVLKDEPGWIVFGEKEEIEEILTQALTCTDSVAQQEAQNLINRLVSRGHTGYGDLLKLKPKHP